MTFRKGISNLKFQIITNVKLIGNWKLDIGYWRFQSGFSLIELMVVVSLFGIAASLVTASYLSFERSQRIRSAASQLKSDVRLTQNDATSGNHGVNNPPFVEGGPNNIYCPVESAHYLGGWYLLVNTTQNFYKVGGDCVRSSDGNETIFMEKTIYLPKDISINRIFYDAGNISQPMAVFFRPLKNSVSFHNGGATFPGFFTSDGVTLDNTMPGLPQDSAVTIELINSGDKVFQVKIQPTGEVNDVAP